VLTPVTDAEAALRPGAERVHPGGNVVRHVRIRRGDPQAPADIVVRGRYQVGMQDQAFLGPESGLAVPAENSPFSPGERPQAPGERRIAPRCVFTAPRLC
jgi:CO/xanthine dehydrogenase Mo-binding subunit